MHMKDSITLNFNYIHRRKGCRIEFSNTFVFLSYRNKNLIILRSPKHIDNKDVSNEAILDLQACILCIKSNALSHIGSSLQSPQGREPVMQLTVSYDLLRSCPNVSLFLKEHK